MRDFEEARLTKDGFEEAGIEERDASTLRFYMFN